ncbi:MAG: UDP-N-acetylmuramoyl-tripeptide--D-alanyl-D-alanine ligase [Gammaproteobacteria bacterium]|nr:UDP-N-acetylmuramoyl-tripeptide--D-alanyl-D-alanine ligase [Gammaproteobacteria bacterium]NIM74902.1 UDP-N-acetylmuramoyl-tripeptide--D-alanyl-D-alanine ligase [Gammaproteobacteria bacterium]NIN39691.1 UDP-N-acetylmuramoyl-tripeptide--D-alanyl-D-alanine ligase [Gammaproteobacteria bacterium]NIO26819.1 UDP-N-acetylmuramoyl-tripeptide--D-alanyl-D-alanine ligase [Gammaproteobacteria bacterium]NIO67375.1 UDP-N-acetylmuramoyl-tripeptide--D-alanyl-D-alanine ligase [Gammaproteobacteria bacterium]
MIRMQVAEAAAALRAQFSDGRTEFTGCSTDSRSCGRAQLFVALAGPNHDGHAHVAEAGRRGAAAAMVSRAVDARIPTIRVDDTLVALGALAAHWRGRFELPVIGVTGSNGKTTVKEMLAAILRTGAPVLATRGNLNNEIGLPLTLMELGAEHRTAVIEMGANHPGEIARLAELARPHVGVITQCAPAHLEGFGSIEGVARAKGELLEHLDGDGTAVINADDAFAPLWRELAGTRRVLSFAIDAAAEVRAKWREERAGSRVVLATPQGDIELHLALPGRHNVANAAAACAAALAVGATPEIIAAGLESMRPVPGRLEVKTVADDVCIIDDTYNANPASLEAGLEVLAAFPGHHWLVLGDMAELGEDATTYHRQVAERVRAHGVERLLTVGELSRLTTRQFGAGAEHHASMDALIATLKGSLGPHTTVLVKGSRSMGMERVVAALTSE